MNNNIESKLDRLDDKMENHKANIEEKLDRITDKLDSAILNHSARLTVLETHQKVAVFVSTTVFGGIITFIVELFRRYNQ